MIDIEIDVFDEVARAIWEQFPDAFVTSEYVLTPPQFPAVYLEQTTSLEVESMRDSSMQENGNAITFTVNYYSNSLDSGKEDCKALAQIVDTVMRSLNMTRTTFQPIDNAADTSIYRMVARYAGVVDKDKLLYWR